MVQMIKKMPQSQVLQLRQKLFEVFVGTQSLGEESCHGKSDYKEAQ
jgi:hypothetical protein